MRLFALLAASSLFAAPVSAYDLYPDSMNYDSLGGSGTYNRGEYTELRDNDLNRNSLYESTIKDNDTGDYYDCNSLGMCHAR